MCTLKLNRDVTYEELTELHLFMGAQQDNKRRYTDTELFINGTYAQLSVSIDKDGNVTLN